MKHGILNEFPKQNGTLQLATDIILNWHIFTYMGFDKDSSS